MTIHLGTDHAGFETKEAIKKWLIDNGYKIKDHGAFKYDKDDDYPDFIHQAVVAVSKSHGKDKGIILGGSGQGEAMIANRYRGVRAAIYYGGKDEIIKLSREHNDANVLALGARFLTKKKAVAAVKLWLKIPFSKAERHRRRIKKIDAGYPFH